MYLHFSNKREFSRKHVRVQFLSTRRAKIYESTHAYFDEKVRSHILFTNETHVAHSWEYSVFAPQFGIGQSRQIRLTMLTVRELGRNKTVSKAFNHM